MYLLGDDFFQFSCGSYVKNTRISDDATAADTFSILRDRLSYHVAGNGLIKKIHDIFRIINSVKDDA